MIITGSERHSCRPAIPPAAPRDRAGILGIPAGAPGQAITTQSGWQLWRSLRASPLGWKEHRDAVLDEAKIGHWFGTVASEPGIGGDILAARSAARPLSDGNWSMSGDKFMGSGSGITSFMMTIARPEGEDRPDIYLLDTRDLPWDGSRGLKMVRAWDGLGMAATQSHAFRFDDVQVTRHGLQGGVLDLLPQIAPVIGFMFSAVIVGILDAAALEAKRCLGKRAQRLSAFEQTSWIEADMHIWLALQAFQGMSRSLGSENAGTEVLHGKLAIADLSEKALASLSHALGGGPACRDRALSGNGCRTFGLLAT